MNEETKNTPTPEDAAPNHGSQSVGRGALELVRRQRESEHSYRYNLAATELLTPEAEPTPEEITTRLELDHAVKEAPAFSEQIRDAARTNEITFVRDVDSVGVAAAEETLASNQYRMTEHQALRRLAAFVSTARRALENHSTTKDTFPPQLKYLLEDLTFIGEKEYHEAAHGLAAYWKTLLDQDPSLQLLVLSEGADKFELKEEGEEPLVKSGDYLLDTILSYFTDEEARRYAHRLITDPRDITVDNPAQLRSILLDDWTLSGNQLSNAARKFRKDYPALASTLEVQLVAAGRRRITRGLETVSEKYVPEGLPSLPVRAYFMAHDAYLSEDSDAIITGAHSATDYDFELPLASAAALAREASHLTAEQHAILDTMPPVANVVRPYRTPDVVLRQKERFNRFRALIAGQPESQNSPAPIRVTRKEGHSPRAA